MTCARGLRALAACCGLGLSLGLTLACKHSANDPQASDTSGPDLSACEASEDCQTSGFCLADYAPHAGGLFTRTYCSDTCLDDTNLAKVCLDSQSCCPGLLCNLADGLCGKVPDIHQELATGTTSADLDSTTTSS